jgi:hypothetical protein
MRHQRYSGTIRLPFAAYATNQGRDTDLGNLEIEAWYQLDPTEDFAHAAGLSLHVNPGGQPYAWANRPEEVWPGAGLDGLWQVRTTGFGETTVIGRGGVGLHGTRGFEPFPAVWPRVLAAVGVDQVLIDGVGVTGEASMAYWDISPFEVSGFVRGDPVDGVRLRGGLVFPMASWLGWNPVGTPAGLRELTLVFELSTAL